LITSLTKLAQMRPPLDYGGVNVARWRQLVADADIFLARWETEAGTLGWTELDLFGCDSHKPFARIDLAGLVLLLNGRPVVEMTAEAAMIAEHGQRHTRFTRRPARPEQIALWQLDPNA
jgi:hypothetical protein